jgi:hypothetical protein
MPIVFNRRRARHGAHLFLPTAGNDSDHNGTDSSQTHADAIANASQDNRWRGTEE